MLAVLRLGHRIRRDPRVTTHVALVARALGANKIILSGERDEKIIASVNKVCEKWGGKFKASYEKDWKKVMKKFKGVKAHLTMYGLPLNKEIRKLRKEKNILIIIGAEKVPREVYELADYNLAITNQPHSEIAALAVFLHEYFKGKELDKKFAGKTMVVPTSHGKKVVKTS